MLHGGEHHGLTHQRSVLAISAGGKENSFVRFTFSSGYLDRNSSFKRVSPRLRRLTTVMAAFCQGESCFWVVSGPQPSGANGFSPGGVTTTGASYSGGVFGELLFEIFPRFPFPLPTPLPDCRGGASERERAGGERRFHRLRRRFPRRFRP